MRKQNIGNIAGLMVAAAVLVTLQAQATLTFTFDDGNTDLSSVAPPFGTLSLTRVDNNDATVTLTASGLYSFGDGSTLGLNLAGGGNFSISSLSGTTLQQGAAAIGNYSLPGGGNVDGWGSYGFQLDSFDGFNYSVTSLTFNLHTTSGAWTTEAAILTPNNASAEVVGHVFVRNADGSNTGITGYATSSSTSPTPLPEPTTMIASALLLLPFGASTLRMLRKNRTA